VVFPASFSFALEPEIVHIGPVAAAKEVASGILDGTRMQMAPVVCSGLVCYIDRGQNAGANACPKRSITLA
jgi:hypothetical protein